MLSACRFDSLAMRWLATGASPPGAVAGSTGMHRQSKQGAWVCSHSVPSAREVPRRNAPTRRSPTRCLPFSQREAMQQKGRRLASNPGPLALDSRSLDHCATRPVGFLAAHACSMQRGGGAFPREARAFRRATRRCPARARHAARKSRQAWPCGRRARRARGETRNTPIACIPSRWLLAAGLLYECAPCALIGGFSSVGAFLGSHCSPVGALRWRDGKALMALSESGNAPRLGAWVPFALLLLRCARLGHARLPTDADNPWVRPHRGHHLDRPLKKLGIRRC